MVGVDLKVVLVGHQFAGKTTLVERFVNGIFDETAIYQLTIGILYRTKILEIDSKTLNIGIGDAGGEQRLEFIVKECYDKANAVIVCYDPIEEESFRRARYWLRELRYLPEECKVYLCATKGDLLGLDNPASFDLQIVENHAKLMKAKFFLTSSKTGLNCDKLFEEVARDYLSNPEHVEKLNKPEQMEFDKPKQSNWFNYNCFSWIWIYLRRCMYN